MFLNSTSWTLFPLSLLLYQWDSTLQLQGRLELCCFWVPSIYNPGNFNTKFTCRLLANICQNIMTWIGNFNPEYNGSVRANSSRPPFYLLGWQGTKHSQITAAKSYHEDDHRSWVSWNLNIFLKHSPNTSLNSTDYAPLCKGNLHLLHHDFAGPPDQHRSYRAGQTSHISHSISADLLFLRYTVNWLYLYTEIISAFIAMRIYPAQLCSFSSSN